VVGNVALNDVTTTATITPASPASGGTFQLTGYQTVVNLPNDLATAAAAASNPLTGTATTQILASGATPATTNVGPTNFSVTIPSPVPPAGVSLSVPGSPETVSQTFTATSTNITIEEGSSATLNLTIAGQPFPLTCTAYPNNSTASGLGASAPTASPIAPVIAVAGTGSTSTTLPPTPTTAPKGSTTTAAPVTASSRQLSFTGVGPGVGILGILGGALILMGLVLLVLVDAPRRVLGQLAFLSPSRWSSGEALAFLNPGRWTTGRAALGRRTLAFVNPIRSKIARERAPRTSRFVNPIRRRQAPSDGDTGSVETAEKPLVASASLPPTPAPPSAPMTNPAVTPAMPLQHRRRSIGEWFGRLPDASRVLGQNMLRIAHRTAVWLLGR
jgi:hypothetical protein